MSNKKFLVTKEFFCGVVEGFVFSTTGLPLFLLPSARKRPSTPEVIVVNVQHFRTVNITKYELNLAVESERCVIPNSCSEFEEIIELDVPKRRTVGHG